MRKINFIVCHCSDSDVPAHDHPSVIEDWHLARKFTAIGYHFIITKDGMIHKGRPEEVVGAHVKGHNANSIGVCLTGRNEFTEAQFKSLEVLLIDLCSRYGLEKKDILAHNELDDGKSCPNFDLHGWLAERSWH